MTKRLGWLMAMGLAWGLAGTGAAGERAWIRLDATVVLVPLERAAPPATRTAYASWIPDGTERKKNLTFEIPAPGSDAWTDFSVGFTPDADGTCTVGLMGPYHKPNDRLERIDVVFSALAADGATLDNGDFADLAGDRPKGWHPYARNPGDEPACGKGYVTVWHNGSFSQRIALKKGVAVTLRGKCRMAKPADLAAAPGRAGDDRFALAPFTPVPLGAVANMGFADPAADDGVGGWSDQGPENDMAAFPFDRTDFGGIDFAVADPAKNGGKAVLTLNLRHPESRVGKASVRVLPEPVDARYLYLLHASCFNQKPGKLGTVAAVLEGGKRVEMEVVTGRDIADWWNAGTLANGSVVFRKMNPSSSVGVYLSRFKIADGPVKVTALEFASDAAPVWVVAGATLSLRDAPLPAEERLQVRAGPAWKPVDTDALAIVPGSALDCGGWLEPGPAGKHGRAVITPDGDFAFEKRPGQPVRFFAFNAFANHLMTWKESVLREGTAEGTRANIKEFAAKVRRQGYNMVRFQGVDLWLMGGKGSTYAAFDDDHWDFFCWMLQCLREEGVYYGIDLFSYTGWDKFPNQWNDAMAQRYKDRMYFDPDCRRMWRDGVKALLTRANPHGGPTLAADPALVYVDLHNEQELGIWVANEPLSHPDIKPMAEKAYRDFLRKRYNDDYPALAKAWKLPGGQAGGGFDTLPLFAKADLFVDTPKGRDINDFVYAIERDMLAFYRQGLADVGYRGFATLYDVLGYYRFISLRRDTPVITSHGYHNHPSDNNRPGSRMAQNSLVDNGVQYLRYMAGMRVWNRPFVVTEYNAPFWGRYRHQEGLVFGAYGALQDYAGITVHSLAVTRKAAPLEDFQLGRDPVGRAGQVVAAFAYGRGDVRPARHKVGVALSEAFMKDGPNMNRGLGSDQNRIALLTRLGVVLDGDVPKGLPKYPRLDLTLPPTQGGESTATAMFAVPVDRNSPKDLAGVVDRLRRADILPANNLTDPAAGIFQSDTGELTLWAGKNLFTADTPRLQGAASPGGREVVLRDVAFTPSVASAVTVIAADNEPIARSRRLLVVFATDALNSGMELSADRTVLYKLGTLPALVETGKLALSVANETVKKAYALHLTGARRDAVALRTEGGRTWMEVDTAALPSGPALFFELTE